MAIGYALNLRMASIEEITGKTPRGWVSFLPTVIEAINMQIKERKPKKGDQADKGLRCDKKKGCPLLKEGTRVRVILGEPRGNVTDKVLQGKFRAGDRRWDRRIRTIYQVLLRPDQPVMYIVTKPESDQPDKVAYTREQLQVVKAKEPEPIASQLNIPKNTEGFQVHSLLERKKEKGRIQFKVRWVGYPEPKDHTWEPRASLMKGGKEVQDMIKAFEKSSQ